MNDKCDNELTGRQKTYCSDKCKQAAYRNRQAVTDKSSVTVRESVTPERDKGVTGSVTIRDKIPNFGQPGCMCMHCQSNRTNGSKHVINHGPYKTTDELGHHELNRVSLPGDPDYAGVRPS